MCVGPGMAAHTFSRRTQEAEAGGALEFETSLVKSVKTKHQRNRKRKLCVLSGPRTPRLCAVYVSPA